MDSLQSLQSLIKNKDNFRNFVNCSNVPTVCKTEECMLGVDEAGRGPVLGLYFMHINIEKSNNLALNKNIFSRSHGVWCSLLSNNSKRYS